MFRSLWATCGVVGCLLVGYLMWQGSLNVLLHHALPVGIMVTGSVALGLWMLFPQSSLAAARNPSLGAEAGRVGRTVWKTAEGLSWIAGGFAFLVGILIAIGYLDMPTPMVGGKVGRSVVAILAGLVQVAFCRMMVARCEVAAQAVRSGPGRRPTRWTRSSRDIPKVS